MSMRTIERKCLTNPRGSKNQPCEGLSPPAQAQRFLTLPIGTRDIGRDDAVRINAVQGVSVNIYKDLSLSFEHNVRYNSQPAGRDSDGYKFRQISSRISANSRLKRTALKRRR